MLHVHAALPGGGETLGVQSERKRFVDGLNRRAEIQEGASADDLEGPPHLLGPGIAKAEAPHRPIDASSAIRQEVEDLDAKRRRLRNHVGEGEVGPGEHLSRLACHPLEALDLVAADLLGGARSRSRADGPRLNQPDLSARKRPLDVHREAEARFGLERELRHLPDRFAPQPVEDSLRIVRAADFQPLAFEADASGRALPRHQGLAEPLDHLDHRLVARRPATA